MYRVNGAFPSYSAALHTLQPGDRVEWLYTTNLGKDVGGYINDIEKGSGQTENNSNKGNEQDKATQLESNKADNKNQGTVYFHYGDNSPKKKRPLRIALRGRCVYRKFPTPARLP